MTVRWLTTLEGDSLAFPGHRIVAGEVVTLEEGQAERAIADGLAEDSSAPTPVATLKPFVSRKPARAPEEE